MASHPSPAYSCSHQPPLDCPLCPRLVTFRNHNRQEYPAFFNNPVPSFGSLQAPLLVVGLAPGLKGANATGRPFTGDYAGIVLYPALIRFGLARGNYQADPNDNTELLTVRITNAVRCLPPENKPETTEIKQCNPFLRQEILAMPNLTTLLALGNVSHGAILTAFGAKKAAHPFAHAAEHQITDPQTGRRYTLVNSYHTSRYNINTGRLTYAMFDRIIERLSHLIAIPEHPAHAFTA